MYNDLIREATAEEMAIFNRVNEVVNNLDDEKAERFIEIVGDRVFEAWTGDRNIYQRVYRLGKKYGFTVEELETWYCID